jgi:hypothetical protein
MALISVALSAKNVRPTTDDRNPSDHVAPCNFDLISDTNTHSCSGGHAQVSALLQQKSEMSFARRRTKTFHSRVVLALLRASGAVRK